MYFMSNVDSLFLFTQHLTSLVYRIKPLIYIVIPAGF